MNTTLPLKNKDNNNKKLRICETATVKYFLSDLRTSFIF